MHFESVREGQGYNLISITGLLESEIIALATDPTSRREGEFLDPSTDEWHRSGFFERHGLHSFGILNSIIRVAAISIRSRFAGLPIKGRGLRRMPGDSLL
jgi:hypothetical protein